MAIAEGGQFKSKRRNTNVSEMLRQATRGQDKMHMTPISFRLPSDTSLASNESLHSVGGRRISISKDPYSIEGKIGLINPASHTFKQARWAAYVASDKPKRTPIGITNQVLANKRGLEYINANPLKRKLLEKQYLRENHQVIYPRVTKVKRLTKEALIKTANISNKVSAAAQKGVSRALNLSLLAGSVGSIVSHYDEKTGRHIVQLASDIGNVSVGLTTAASTLNRIGSTATFFSKAFQTAENAILVDTKIANNAVKTAATAGILTSGGLNFVADTALIVSYAVDFGFSIKSYFDFQKQKEIEDHPDQWPEHFDYYVKEDNFVKYTFGTYKGEANYNPNAAFTSEREVVVDLFSATLGKPNDKQFKWPTMDEIEKITNEGANQYHYKLLADNEYHQFHYEHPEIELRMILRDVQYNKALYGITLGSTHIGYTGKSLYIVDNPEKIDYSTEKILRFVEIPTILGNSEQESIEKFIFQRQNNGEKFTDVRSEMILGTRIGTNYYDWIAIKENQESVAIFQLWKSTYPNISFDNIKTAFADPSNPPSSEELAYMNTNKTSLNAAKTFALKQESSEVKQLAQTQDLLDIVAKQLLEFLENSASDPQNVFSYLNTTGAVYGGWTDKSWSFLWDNIYNVWRQSRGLPSVARNSESNSGSGSVSAYIEGEPITPQSQLFAPLYKPQNQKFKKQFHGKSRRHLS
jgi:hypothetical protein